MRIKPLTLALFILLFALIPACGPAEAPPTPSPTDSLDEPTAAPTETTAPADTAGPTPTAAPGEPTPLPAYEAPPLPTDRSAFFSASGACASCHNNLTDEVGNDVSNDTNWRASMMANAARDPYWQASVRSEVLDHPQLKSVIEDKCATCHTLYTPYVDEEGEVAGTFPEQVPYLEWQHSDYADDTSCQDCHMPPAEGAVDIASTGGGPPRSPFAQHLFIGGNTYVLKMLWAFGEEIGVTASSDHLERKVEQTLDQLQDRTATLSVENVSVADVRLAFDVAVEAKTGHKFPSGFPSRRTWLHVTVEDSEGTVVFESGAVASDGSIAGNDNDVDPAAYEPHYEEITAEDQVQIYEPILVNLSGEVTTGLIQAMGYRKDNRLLPSGFDKGSAGKDFAVYGSAAEDDDFVGGGDTVRYRAELAKVRGELTVTVELLYQSIGYRWAEDLRRHEDAAEVRRFLDRYDALPNQPVTVAAATATTPA